MSFTHSLKRTRICIAMWVISGSHRFDFCLGGWFGSPLHEMSARKICVLGPDQELRGWKGMDARTRERELISDRLEREKMVPKECFLDSNLLMMPPGPGHWLTDWRRRRRCDVVWWNAWLFALLCWRLSAADITPSIFQLLEAARWAVHPFRFLRGVVCTCVSECAGF